MLVAKLRFGIAIPWLVIIVTCLAGVFFDLLVTILIVGVVFFICSYAFKQPKDNNARQYRR